MEGEAEILSHEAREDSRRSRQHCGLGMPSQSSLLLFLRLAHRPPTQTSTPKLTQPPPFSRSRAGEIGCARLNGPTSKLCSVTTYSLSLKSQVVRCFHNPILFAGLLEFCLLEPVDISLAQPCTPPLFDSLCATVWRPLSHQTAYWFSQSH